MVLPPRHCIALSLALPCAAACGAPTPAPNTVAAPAASAPSAQPTVATASPTALATTQASAEPPPPPAGSITREVVAVKCEQLCKRSGASCAVLDVPGCTERCSAEIGGVAGPCAESIGAFFACTDGVASFKCKPGNKPRPVGCDEAGMKMAGCFLSNARPKALPAAPQPVPEPPPPPPEPPPPPP